MSLSLRLLDLLFDSNVRYKYEGLCVFCALKKLERVLDTSSRLI